MLASALVHALVVGIEWKRPMLPRVKRAPKVVAVRFLGEPPQRVKAQSSPPVGKPKPKQAPKPPPPPPPPPVPKPPPPPSEAPIRLAIRPPQPEESAPPPPHPLPQLPAPQLPEPAPEAPEPQAPEMATPDDLLAALPALGFHSDPGQDDQAPLGKFQPAYIAANSETLGSDAVATYALGRISQEALERYVRTHVGVDIAQWPGTEDEKVNMLVQVVANYALRRMMLHEAETLGLTKRSGIEYTAAVMAEDTSIAEVTSRAVGGEIRVTKEEIKEWQEKHRDELKGLPASAVEAYVADRIAQEKGKHRLDEFLAELKAKASIERHYEVLDAANVGDEAVLFSVNGVPYTMAQWRTEWNHLTAEERKRWSDPARKRELAEGLLVRQLLLQSNRQQGEDQSQDRTELMREEIILSLLHNELVHKDLAVTEAELKDRYRKEGSRYQITAAARIAFLASPPLNADNLETIRKRVETVRAAVQSGTTFLGAIGGLVKQKPGPHDYQGGLHPDWIPQGSYHLADMIGALCEFCRQVFALKPGETSQPFQYAGRLWLVQAVEVRPGRQATLQEVRPFLTEDIAREKHDTAQTNMYRRLMGEADLTVNIDRLRAMAAPHGDSATVKVQAGDQTMPAPQSAPAPKTAPPAVGGG